MAYYTPSSYVNKFGSAKSGTSHHIRQRVTAVFMIPLFLWFVYTVFVLLHCSPEEVNMYITSPQMIIGAVLFTLNMMYHATLGLQMIIEDYISCKIRKKIALITMLAVNITVTVSGIISMLVIHFISRIV